MPVVLLKRRRYGWIFSQKWGFSFRPLCVLLGRKGAFDSVVAKSETTFTSVLCSRTRCLNLHQLRLMLCGIFSISIPNIHGQNQTY